MRIFYAFLAFSALACAVLVFYCQAGISSRNQMKSQFDKLEYGMAKRDAIVLIAQSTGNWKTLPDKDIRELWTGKGDLCHVGFSDEGWLSYMSWREKTFLETLILWLR